MRLFNLTIKSLIGLGILMLYWGCTNPIKDPFSEEAMQERRRQVLEELNLTKDQQEQIKQLWLSQKPLFEKKQGALLEARWKLDLAMKQEASKEELKNLFQELEKRRHDLFFFRFDHVIAIRNLLTSEQRQKFLGFGRWPRESNKGPMHNEP